ncbi:MAG TPA: Rieske 2Fe-2S domain-containing protein [Thermoanaerobaculia bacterium]
MESEFVEITTTGALPAGRMKAFKVGERTIALCHTAAGFFAVDNTCPHRGGPLAEGDLLGNEIVCPWHLWGFDAVTGVCNGNPEITIVTHEVRIDDDRVLVKLR